MPRLPVHVPIAILILAQEKNDGLKYFHGISTEGGFRAF